MARKQINEGFAQLAKMLIPVPTTCTVAKCYGVWHYDAGVLTKIDAVYPGKLVERRWYDRRMLLDRADGPAIELYRTDSSKLVRSRKWRDIASAYSNTLRWEPCITDPQMSVVAGGENNPIPIYATQEMLMDQWRWYRHGARHTAPTDKIFVCEDRCIKGNYAYGVWYATTPSTGIYQMLVRQLTPWVRRPRAPPPPIDSSDAQTGDTVRSMHGYLHHRGPAVERANGTIEHWWYGARHRSLEEYTLGCSTSIEYGLRCNCSYIRSLVRRRYTPDYRAAVDALHDRVSAALKMGNAGLLNRPPCRSRRDLTMFSFATLVTCDKEKAQGYQPTVVHANGVREYHESGLPITHLGVALGRLEGEFMRANLEL